MAAQQGDTARHGNTNPAGNDADSADLGSVPGRLTALRAELRREGLHAYVVPSADPHQSEYVAERFKGRQWLSGFHGSAGTVVVTLDDAGLWTDSRYYLEAESVLAGTGIRLFKMDEPGVPSYPAWLASVLPPEGRVGVWSDGISVAAFRGAETTLREAGLTIEATRDLLGRVWPDRPELPSKPVFTVPQEHAGRSRSEKLDQLRAELRAQQLDGWLVPALDEVAWLFNLRGSDIPYNPVFLAYALVTADAAVLCVDADKLDTAEQRSVQSDGIILRAYGDIGRSLAEVPPGRALGIDPQAVTPALRNCIPEGVTVKEAPSPISAAKARKNSAELDGMRLAMRKDAVAMERFLYWLEQAVPTGLVTEGKAAGVLGEFRAEQADFVGESFQTISAYRGHGAIVHYRVTEESDAQLRNEGLYLVDSGGQYRHGTTDITRVVPFGDVTAIMREDYTLVLKGHIALATAQFPEGTTGLQLDALARMPLWQAGRDYGHGTGHGVGCFLNVHETPPRIGPKKSALVPLQVGMVVSNEPGVYREGEYGIRIENLVSVREAEPSLFGRFYAFETLTLCHLDTRLVEPGLLTDRERAWLNAYNERVYRSVSEELEKPVRAWLAERTAAL